MNFIEKKLIVSQEKLDAGFINLYTQLYPLPCHWDDDKKTHTRIADIRDGTIVPTPVLNNESPTGNFYIIALWPEQFISDIENYPNVTLPLAPNTDGLSSEEAAQATAVYDATCEVIRQGINGLTIENI